MNETSTTENAPVAFNRRVVVMGVSGSGKSTIGAALGRQLDIPYIDGDTYHPQANIDKMSRGEPLDDADRHDWLARLTAVIRTHHERDAGLLLGCSALKRRYRDQLRTGDPNLLFLFLDGRFDTIRERMRERRHFFSDTMLESQFDALEVPADDEAIRIDINRDTADVVADCTARLSTPVTPRSVS